MDPRHRADEALSRARSRGAFVVTPDNATSPMDAASTVRIPREVVSGLGGQDPNSTVALRRDQGQWDQGQREQGQWDQGQRDQRYQAQREPGRGHQQAPPQQQPPQQYGQQPAPQQSAPHQYGTQQYGTEQYGTEQPAPQQTGVQQANSQQVNSQQTVWPTEEPTNTQYYYPAGHEPTRPFQR